MEFIQKWKYIIDNASSDSNIVNDANNNAIFYYNTFSDEVLKERKQGNLVCYNLLGDELWKFTFPKYSYLYFTGNIINSVDGYFLIADSNLEFDSGFERGVYHVNNMGEIVKIYTQKELLKSAPKIKEVAKPIIDADICSKFKEHLKKPATSITEINNKIIVLVSSNNSVELLCYEAIK